MSAMIAVGFGTCPAQESESPAMPSKTSPAAAKSIVYHASDIRAIGAGRRANDPVVRRMVDALVCAVTNCQDPASAWASLVKKNDIVGIKVAASGGVVSGTNPAVVNAIVDGLAARGIPGKRIIVWDRNLSDLLASGYIRDGSRYQLRWVDPRTGYDRQSAVSAPVIGKLIWGDSGFGKIPGGGRFADLANPEHQLSNQSYYATVLTKEVTKVINVPSLADSFLTGVNGALANMTLPNLDNWRRFTKPPAYGDPFLAEIYADAVIRDKVVLTILDGLVMQYAGGPFPNPGFLVDHSTLYASKDPVAIDATALRLLEEARKPSRLPPIAPMAAWLESAATIGLGHCKETEIDLVRVGADRAP